MHRVVASPRARFPLCFADDGLISIPVRQQSDFFFFFFEAPCSSHPWERPSLWYDINFAPLFWFLCIVLPRVRARGLKKRLVENQTLEVDVYIQGIFPSRRRGYTI